MADPNEKEKKQVMDVAKPGSTSADPSSRPIIVNHGGMMKDPMVTDTAPAPETKAESPAAEPAQAATEAAKPGIMPSHRVIQPLTGDKPAEEEKKPEQPAEESEADISNGIEGSDEAVVDAVVGQAGGKKKEGELTEEEKKQQEALEKLVEDKTYFVPVGQVHRRHRRNALLVVSLLLLLAAGGLGYAFQSGLIKLNKAAPVAQPVATQSTTSTQSQPKVVETPVFTLPAGWTKYTSANFGVAFATPSAWIIADHTDTACNKGKLIHIAPTKAEIATTAQATTATLTNVLIGYRKPPTDAKTCGGNSSGYADSQAFARSSEQIKTGRLKGNWLTFLGDKSGTATAIVLTTKDVTGTKVAINQSNQIQIANSTAWIDVVFDGGKYNSLASKPIILDIEKFLATDLYKSVVTHFNSFE